MSKATNIVWHDAGVSPKERQENIGSKSCILWYTGLSGSGKSTVANAVDRLLFDKGYITYLLDGDNVRHGLNKDLGFSDEDRVENIRRISEVSNLFLDAGLIVSTAFISPFRADRLQAKALIGDERFIEVFVDAPLKTCEERDPKGLYQKARDGMIKNFTGIDSPYESPLSPSIHLSTNCDDIEQCANQVVDYLLNNKFIK
ncbi:adenylyl-sulfate kinase [Psychrobacter immobilis]|uniref:adenylyl-sulfate kinase n=1 Tax=Psychrobacter immobilis TaxID=498 RepID=UPI001917B9CB|nr:adenylyl-sulfate kinase [Psychrobacter immobilis]